MTADDAAPAPSLRAGEPGTPSFTGGLHRWLAQGLPHPADAVPVPVAGALEAALNDLRAARAKMFSGDSSYWYLSTYKGNAGHVKMFNRTDADILCAMENIAKAAEASTRIAALEATVADLEGQCDDCHVNHMLQSAVQDHRERAEAAEVRNAALEAAIEDLMMALAIWGHDGPHEKGEVEAAINRGRAALSAAASEDKTDG